MLEEVLMISVQAEPTSSATATCDQQSAAASIAKAARGGAAGRLSLVELPLAGLQSLAQLARLPLELIGKGDIWGRVGGRTRQHRELLRGGDRYLGDRRPRRGVRGIDSGHARSVFHR